jgi:ribosomal protein S7
VNIGPKFEVRVIRTGDAVCVHITDADSSRRIELTLAEAAVLWNKLGFAIGAL